MFSICPTPATDTGQRVSSRGAAGKQRLSGSHVAAEGAVRALAPPTFSGVDTRLLMSHDASVLGQCWRVSRENARSLITIRTPSRSERRTDGGRRSV